MTRVNNASKAQDENEFAFLARVRARERLYDVRRGLFKTSARSEDGRQQVTGVWMPAEIVCPDGIGTDRHNCDAVALDQGEVCVIFYDKLLGVGRESEALEHHPFKVPGREVARDHGDRERS